MVLHNHFSHEQSSIHFLSEDSGAFDTFRFLRLVGELSESSSSGSIEADPAACANTSPASELRLTTDIRPSEGWG